jgi:NAD+ synthase (glutamine-hydrolysing)
MEVFQRRMKIAMAQVNATVGDLEGNVKKIEDFIAMAKKKNVDLVAFPELAVTGYPPQDLILDREFVRRGKELLDSLIDRNTDMAAIVGFVDLQGERLHNSASVFIGSKRVGVVNKALLPTYDVFDEDRYFEPAREEDIKPIRVNLGGQDLNLGVQICEDLWDNEYKLKATDTLVRRGADVIVNISASPFYAGKRSERIAQLSKKSGASGVPIFYVNLVGGQDELVFDGQSLATDRHGNLTAIGRQFEEDLVVVEVDSEEKIADGIEPLACSREKEILGALVLGVRDYYRKTGFRRAIVGLSGGIDSSLSACIAVEALGNENVIGVSMPSMFSSDHSKADAEELAHNLGIYSLRFGIQPIADSYQETLRGPLEEVRQHFVTSIEQDDPVADENIQPRARGNCLMDISNRLRGLGIMVLNTGNKTELALGYCTLYGDMAGGIGALGDVSKLDVYKIAQYFNEMKGRQIIPASVFVKKPSPELREGQVDPFDFNVISPLVDEIIEHRRSKQDLISAGYPEDVVEDTFSRIRRAEYKRRQAVPCIKITPKAFGIGWKMPIVNGYTA